MELSEFLTWLVNGGGAGIVAYWLMDNLEFLRGLSSEWKRYASLGLAAGLAMLAFAAGVWLGYVDAPAGAQGWLEALFSVAALALGISQAWHGRAKLR